jgi:hypothetical protein
MVRLALPLSADRGQAVTAKNLSSTGWHGRYEDRNPSQNITDIGNSAAASNWLRGRGGSVIGLLIESSGRMLTKVIPAGVMGVVYARPLPDVNTW